MTRARATASSPRCASRSGDQVENGAVLLVRRSRRRRTTRRHLMADPIRIANCSGFFGDRLSRPREMVEGGPIDVLTGDWLAELTMLILARTQAKRPGGGYARTFVDPDGAGAGHLPRPGHQGGVQRRRPRPGRLRRGGRRGGRQLGLSPDDRLRRRRRPDAPPRRAGRRRRRPAPTSTPASRSATRRAFITANAYLGCWGIVEALERRRRHRDHRPGHRRRGRRAARRPGTTAGRATTGTRWPAPSWPAT